MLSFIESRLFTRLIGDYLPDQAYASLQRTLAGNPTSGAVIPGTGGIRKLRWALPGRGKRGGVRVIYFARPAEGVIWMLTIYAKNEAQDIPTSVLRRIKEEIDG